MALQYQQNDDHDEQADKQPGLLIDISPALRSRLKRAAAKHDLPIDEYVEDILEKAVLQEEESTAEQEQHEPRPISKEGLEGLLRLREQIKQNHPGQVFEDSTEIIRQTKFRD
jgi:antitoxin component of RelBE/YafQ-DinJ toxin-antitoxin module